jgi:hypothetical protein
VISLALRLASIVCIVALLFSFAAFATDAAGDGSKQTVSQIAAADDGPQRARATPAGALDAPRPPARVERLREKQHSAPREFADDANDVLTAPFTSIVGSGSIWAQRIVSGLLALLLFGAGLGYAARVATLRGV